MPAGDWRTLVKYHDLRTPNREFVAATRQYESTDLSEAVARYSTAIEKMYEYEKIINNDHGDDNILDRLTLCLWKLKRYEELISATEKFVAAFPSINSTKLTAVLKRRDKASQKITSAQPTTEDQQEQEETVQA